MSHIAPEFEVSNDEQDPFIVQEVLKMPAPSDLVGAGVISFFGGIIEITLGGYATLLLNIYGTYVATNVFEATVDDTNWFQIEAWQVSTKSYVTSFIANGRFYIFCSALKKIRIRNTVFASGTCTITYDASSAELYQMLSLDSLGRQITRISGSDPTNVADVILEDSVQRLATTAKVTVQALLAYDDFADTWFKIINAGLLNDTWRIQIVAGSFDSTIPDRDPPATDVTVTVTALEVGDEIALRDKIVAALNANANFSPYWKASPIKDNPMVHISSKKIGDEGERSTLGDFSVTVTGAAVFDYINDENRKILRRGKSNTGVKDPRDKRFVTFGISGEVQAVPGSVGDLIIANALNAGSPDLRVNGSLVTPIVFTVPAEANKDIFIEELRFYGNANGIQFGKFLGLNAPITNGILIEIRSDEVVTQLPLIKTTDDFKHKFAFGTGTGFQLNVQAGRDDFMASFSLTTTFPIRKAGTFVSGDDYVKVYIRDNLSAGLLALEFLARGFKKEV